jgi:cytochrome c oxidase subunit 2
MFGTRMAKVMISSRLALSGVAALAASGAALAEQGRPFPWQKGLQPSVTEVADNIHWFHNVLLMPIITVISLFVLGLLVYIVVRFNEKANPVPSKTTHHTGLEVAWTVIPVLILVVIAIPSFRILKEQVVIPKSDMTIKVTGKQWYWTFEYAKDSGGIAFDAIMMSDADRAKAIAGGANPEDVPRLLAVDNEAVVPVNKVVRVQVTAADVIHAFAVQSFGVKIDAVPGRLNETWFKAAKEGVYYGQCQELCGKDHAFMPLVIRVVSQEKYDAWLKEAQKKFSTAPAPAIQFADTTSPRR